MTAIFILIAIYCFCAQETSALFYRSKKVWEPKTITQLNTPQIIKSFGYPAESHTVKTKDGYILEMHRIVAGRHGESDPKPHPVFLVHGLLGSSGDFLLLSSENALPFLLANRGYDVWLGNVRGNTYCKAHINYFVSNSSFWDFTFHESAIYDLPAQMDYILQRTDHEKLNYIGYSFGTTLFLALTSTMPEYNQKINVALLMSPIAFVKHTQSPVLRFLSPYSTNSQKTLELTGNGDFSPQNQLMEHLGEKLCNGTTKMGKLFCSNMIFMIAGINTKYFNKKLLPMITTHYPEGYSAKAINHFSQMVKSGKFQQYDYGPSENQKHYGSKTPPQYKLSNVVAPVLLYVGQNDYLTNLKDVQTLTGHLKNLRAQQTIKQRYFSHLDFLISADVRSNVYEPLIKHLAHFSKE